MAADTDGDPHELADALRAAQKGGQPAFRTIYLAHQPALLRYCAWWSSQVPAVVG